MVQEWHLSYLLGGGLHPDLTGASRRPGPVCLIHGISSLGEYDVFSQMYNFIFSILVINM